MIECYTDGSSSLKQHKGGSGIVILEGDKRELISFPMKDVKTGQAELIAMIICLETLYSKNKQNELITLYSDSEYCVNSVNIWGYNWVEKKDLSRTNGDLLIWLFFLKLKFTNIVFKHIKGHAGNEGNELADQLATNWRALEDEELCPIYEFEEEIREKSRACKAKEYVLENYTILRVI